MRDYLGIAGEQDDLIHLIVSLCDGVVSDEGLDRDGLGRLGDFLKQYLARRSALNNFFLGEPPINEIRDRATAQAELAFIRTRLEIGVEDPSGNEASDDEEDGDDHD